MVKLVFNRKAIPRSTTREQWRAIDRWRRVTERELRKHEDEMRRAVMDCLSVGYAALAVGFADRLTNPPVMPYPADPQGEVAVRRIAPGSIYPAW